MSENITIKEAIVEEINLIEKYKFFPQVKAVGQLNKGKQRKIKVANLDGEKFILYHYGQYKYTENFLKLKLLRFSCGSSRAVLCKNKSP